MAPTPPADPLQTLIEHWRTEAAKTIRYPEISERAVLREAQASVEDFDTPEDPQRTLDSLAAILGWGNTPPRRVFEQEIKILRERFAALREDPPAPAARNILACVSGHVWTSDDCAYRGGEWDWPCDCGKLSRDFPPDSISASEGPTSAARTGEKG